MTLSVGAEGRLAATTGQWLPCHHRQLASLCAQHRLAQPACSPLLAGVSTTMLLQCTSTMLSRHLNSLITLANLF